VRWGFFICIFTISFVAAGQAHAVSQRVRNACRDDYHRFCSAYAVGTPELRQCMTRVGSGLSRGCINALLETGEINGHEADLQATRH
jgi:adenylate kinase